MSKVKPEEILYSLIKKCVEQKNNKKIPIECFLNRVFPSEHYEGEKENYVKNKVFQPRRDAEPLCLKVPIDWDSLDRKDDRNWRMQLQGMAMFHPIMNFFDDYENKNEVVSYFFEICNDWLDKFGEEDPQFVTSRMPEKYTWYDMSVGFRALVVAFFLDRISFYSIKIRDEDLLTLSKMVEKHIVNLSYEKAFSLNNHGMFQVHGLMALISLVGVEKYKNEYDFALQKMEALALSQYTCDGIHLEHSPHYHFYATKTFKGVVKSGWYDNSSIIVDIVHRADAAKKWLIDPKFRPACIGDSILTVQRGVDTALKPDDRFKEFNRNDKKFFVSDFNQSGYSIIRSDWDYPVDKSFYLFFMGMYQSKVHKHRDCLSFEWFDNGEKIICDSGKYGYKSDKYRHYFLSSRAHNSVEIEGFDILKIKPYGSSIASSNYENGVFNIRGLLDYPAIYFERNIFVNPGRWLVIVDDLKFKRARWATQWLHFDPRFSLCSLNNNKAMLKSKGGDNLIVHCLSEGVESSFHFGDEDEMQGFISEKDYSFESGVALGFKFHGSKNKLVTLIALDDENYSNALSFIKDRGFSAADVISYEAESSKPLIPNVTHFKLDNIKEASLHRNKNTYSIRHEDVSFDFYMDLKDSDSLIIMFPGAVDRKRGTRKIQRHTWSDDFDSSVISFLDNTVNDNNDLNLGWYQGSNGNYLIPKLASLINELINKLSIDEDKVLLFGSSAGGFAALQLANYLPAIKIMAINPQVYLHSYSKLHFNKLLEYSYKGISREVVLDKYKSRVSVKLDFSKRTEPVFYFQNVSDHHHVEHHLNRFITNNNIAEYLTEFDYNKHDKLVSNKLNVIHYDDPSSGHSPPSKDDTMAMIKYVFDMQKKVSGNEK